MQKFKNKVEIIKEVSSLLDALPSTPEELLEIEREIEQAEKYFEMIDKKNEIEKEVEGLKNILKELEKLPENKEICPTDTRPEH